MAPKTWVSPIAFLVIFFFIKVAAPDGHFMHRSADVTKEQSKAHTDKWLFRKIQITRTGD